MKENLHIAPGSDGWARFFRFSGYVHHMHRHTELEINLVTRGRGTYLLADQRYEIRRGSQLWLFPGQEYVLVNPSRDFETWIAVFRPEVVQRVAVQSESRVLGEQSPRGHFIRQIATDHLMRLASLFDEIAGVESGDQARHNAGLAYLLLTAWSIHLRSDELAAERELHPAVEAAVRLLRDETEAMNLEQLSERCGLSPSRLSRIFKEQTGISLVNYRQKACLERFLKMYGHGRKTNMLACALDVGFGSYPQFHRVFKQYMNRSPAEYRREISRSE
jgi:AraC-like DNA-binding protein